MPKKPPVRRLRILDAQALPPEKSSLIPALGILSLVFVILFTVWDGFPKKDPPALNAYVQSGLPVPEKTDSSIETTRFLEIDYQGQTGTAEIEAAAVPVSAYAADLPDFYAAEESASESAVYTYVLNTNSKKFHDPGCVSVGQIKAENKRVVESTRDDLIAQGYAPCKRCNP